jgi:hypothetical protein
MIPEQLQPRIVEFLQQSALWKAHRIIDGEPEEGMTSTAYSAVQSCCDRRNTCLEANEPAWTVQPDNEAAYILKEIEATQSNDTRAWHGVDLDGTLAHYDGWKGIAHIGAPISAMRERVLLWLSQGKRVKIFTARVDGGNVALSMGNKDGEAHRDVAAVRRHIEDWCVKHLGQKLEITCKKDYAMECLYDDRAVQVVPNTGEVYLRP